MARSPNDQSRPEGRPQPTTDTASLPSRHYAHGWRAIARGGLVYLTEVDTDRDPGLTVTQALEVAEAIFEAAYDARRGGQP